MPRLLLVEDDPDLSEGLTDALRLEGYQVTAALDGNTGIRLAQSRSFQLIILDAMLPGLSGFDFLRRLRESNHRTPVIMLTAKGQEMDKVRGLKLGADDYVTKPFGMMELLARVEALLRRTREQGLPDTFAQGEVEVDFRSRRAWRRRRPLSLTGREFEILQLLAGRRGEAVSRSELVAHIWGSGDEVEVSTRTIDQHVASLRKKLEEDPSRPRLIETVYGFGYRLAGHPADR